ncbi:MAG: Crp/Fnr family transcriptional regulator [Candidatus Thiodiazotropha sp.]
MITDSSATGRILRQFSFLQQTDDSFQRRFFHSVSLITLPAGQPICQQGSQCSHLALVTSGKARVYKIGENGREITLYRIGPGESCILTASCIVNGSPFPAFAVSEESIEAVLVSPSDVVRWSDEEAGWRNYLFSLVSNRLSEVIGIIEEIAFRRVDTRLASYLLLRPAVDGRIELTHQAIASDLGTSREVISRILKDLEQRQLIRIHRGAIEILDRDLLTVLSTQ